MALYSFHSSLFIASAAVHHRPNFIIPRDRGGARRLGHRHPAGLGLMPAAQAAQALHPPSATLYTKLNTFQGGSEPQRGKVPAQGHTAQADAGRSGVWGLKGREPEALRDPTASLLGWNPHMPVLSPGQLGGGG